MVCITVWRSTNVALEKKKKNGQWRRRDMKIKRNGREGNFYEILL